MVKAFRLNSYNNNVNNNVNNNNNNGVNFNALNTANALNSVSLTGLGSLYGGNVLRPSVIYRCVQEFTFELLDLKKESNYQIIQNISNLIIRPGQDLLLHQKAEDPDQLRGRTLLPEVFFLCSNLICCMFI